MVKVWIMVQPGRNWSSNDYRYGYNGKEEVMEINNEGNHYTALFGNMYPRIGRRWNGDPKPNPSVSDYAILAHNPNAKLTNLEDIKKEIVNMAQTKE